MEYIAKIADFVGKDFVPIYKKEGFLYNLTQEERLAKEKESKFNKWYDAHKQDAVKFLNDFNDIEQASS